MNIYQRKINWIPVYLLLLVLHVPAFAQSIFKGIVVNKQDFSAIPYVAVMNKESSKSVITDINGAFQFSVPAGVKKITLNISAIGVKTSVIYTYPFNKTEVIYVDVQANALNGVAIKGLSAEDVVKKAVALIPVNYADSSYFGVSFYRRYQKVNGLYINLFEACPVVMFRISKNNHKLNATEAFAVTHLRRTTFHPDIMNAREGNPLDLLVQNPVYHLDASSLLPSRFPNYYFQFDTTNKSKEDYVIRYVCNNFSTDTHGILGSRLKGEKYEIGELVIDRYTFVIKKINRKSFRHEDYAYNYFNPNNLISYDYHGYLFEFVNGDMEAEYKEYNGKWYLDKLFHQYTNDFYDTPFYTKTYTITDNFEYYSGAASRYITGEYAVKFYSKMATAIHNYDTAFWSAATLPFYYADQETVYKNLERDGSLEKQFFNETKVDEYVKKPGKK